MKVYLLFLLFSINFLFIKCEDDFYMDYEGNPDNINIESISYELTYNNYSVVKVVIKTYDEINSDITFTGYLKSQVEQKEYKLNCTSDFYDIIECYSQPHEKFNLDDKYYFYYNKTKSKFTFDENDILEDDKQISLVFKPEINIDGNLYKDNRKISVDTNGAMVGGGFLYITKKTKDVLNRPADGFNKYIELNNMIANVGFHHDIPISTLKGYKKAIKRGYHIVKAILRFTSDKVPVISHVDDLEKLTDEKGKINEYKFKELLKMDFGSKTDKKYEGEKILSLEILLQLCKDLNVIIDLDVSELDNKKYFQESNHAKKLIDLIEEYEMFDSVYFTDGPEYENVLKLKELKKNIAVCIPINKKEAIEKIKKEFPKSRLILNVGKSLNQDMIKNISSLGIKIKVDDVDDTNYVQKLQDSGVNYMVTNLLAPFIIDNDKEEPLIVRCAPVDEDHSECDIEDDVILKDNEWYNIYYSTNIYKVGEEINEEPIGEFQYIDTNILDELYYKVNSFSFANGNVNLNLSQILKRGEEINGVIGPEHDNVPESYQFNFVCKGKDTYTVDCTIDKEEKGKVEYRGKYCIYSLEDYSLNDYETEEAGAPEETYYEYIVEKKRPHFLIFIIIFVIIICLVIAYYIKNKNKSEFYNRIRVADNDYLSDNYLYR